MKEINNLNTLIVNQIKNENISNISNNQKNITLKEVVNNINNSENQDKNQEKITTENVLSVLANINTQIGKINTDVKFGFSQDINGLYVSIVNKKTNEEIRKIPSDEFISLSKKIEEVIGYIFDEKV